MHALVVLYLHLLLSSTQLVITVTAMVTASPSSAAQNYFIGFDLGTSGARISVIEKASSSSDDTTSRGYNEVHSDATSYFESYDNPNSWTDAIHKLLTNTPQPLRSNTKSICVSGTSASCLLVNPIGGKVDGGNCRKAKMYDYDITHLREGINPAASVEAANWIDKYAPANHATRASTSALSKLLHYHACQPIQPSSEVFAHQSEYVATTIFQSNPKQCGAGNTSNRRVYTSDWHNALKLGCDVQELKYPNWLLELLEEVGISSNVLPQVVEPGKVIGTLSSSIVERYGFREDAVLVGGTTDSNAAFIAAVAAGGGKPKYGVAVTSLGSTLAMKMLSRTFVEDSKRGVYSHRFPVFGQNGGGENEDADSSSSSSSSTEEAWLVGGASNVGCAVLRQEQFSNEELLELSQENHMDVSTNSPYEYYPLTKMGERFPIADGTKQPLLEPKPESRADYLKGILQGIANVERMGFEVLGELGASPSFPEDVWTAGGGSKNDAWLKMRERLLRESFDSDAIQVRRAENAEASFGAAFLAASGFD